MSKSKFEYVCMPRNIHITVERSMINKHLDITLYVDNKPAVFSSYVVVGQYSQNFANDKVISFCDALVSFTENDIQDWANEDKVMLTLNAHRSIKKVMTKGGGTVWNRP